MKERVKQYKQNLNPNSTLEQLANYFALCVQCWDYDYGDIEQSQDEHACRLALLSAMLEKENAVYDTAMKEKIKIREGNKDDTV